MNLLAKRFNLIAVFIMLLTACAPSPQEIPVSTAEDATITPTALPQQTPAPQTTRTPKPTITPIPLVLQKVETFPTTCTEKETGLPGEKLSEVAYLPSGFCFHGELDVFDTGGRTYVAQVVMSNFPTAPEAFRIIDVTDPAQPTLVGAWKWNIPTYSADVKSFKQGERWFLALSRDPALEKTTVDKICDQVGGVAIIEVTNPADPKLITVLTGPNTGQRGSKKWCNSHTAEVRRDANGDGAYLYVSALDIFDLRVLDIRDLANVKETGRYTHPDAGFYNERNWFFVHDTTIVDDRVYVSYWSAGLIILDRETLETGKKAVPLNPLDSIDPWGMQIHHAFPTTDGNFVFIEDEFPSKQPASRLRLFDIRDLQAPREVASITITDSWGAPHNLLVSGDKLFVGWYQDGVRVFQYDVSDPEHPLVEPYAFQAVRSQYTLNPFSRFADGIWGVRLHACVIDDQPRTCVFASDITWGLIILAVEP